jgi:DNA repair exonuclease SbcCD ATPase subunit
MLIFKKARAKNFLSVGNNFLEYDLLQSHLTLIKGSNSAGKSTLIEILTFGLYKKAYRNINLPQLVNNINQKDCLVEVEFSIGNNNWRVLRGLSPNVFEIYKDDVLLDQHSSIIEQQKWFEQNVLKMSYKTFIQIVILGSSSYVPFMQLTPADRREVIEDLLDIKLFSTMHSIVKDKIKSLKDDVKIYNVKKDSLEDKVQMQQDFIEQIEQRSRDDVDNKTKILTGLFDNLNELQTKSNTLTLNSEALQTQIKEFSDVSENLKNLLTNKTRLNLQAQTIKDNYMFFKSNDVCPTCSQDIHVELKKEKLKEGKEKISELKSFYDELNSSLEQEHERENTFKLLTEDLRKINQDINNNNYQITQTNTQIKELHNQIQLINEQIQNKNDEHKKLELFNLQLSEIESNIIQSKEDLHHYDYAQLILKDSGVKSKIVEKYLVVMNQQINKYLDLLELYVNFTLDSEFNEEIVTPTYEKFSYGNFSEGQKRRVDLALLFTWRYISAIKNSASTNLLICDEILDGSLDEMGHIAFLKIIKQEMKTSNIFVISHRDGIDHRFDNVITVEKRGNFTVKSDDNSK